MRDGSEEWEDVLCVIANDVADAVAGMVSHNLDTFPNSFGQHVFSHSVMIVTMTGQSQSCLER